VLASPPGLVLEMFNAGLDDLRHDARVALENIERAFESVAESSAQSAQLLAQQVAEAVRENPAKLAAFVRQLPVHLQQQAEAAVASWVSAESRVVETFVADAAKVRETVSAWIRTAATDNPQRLTALIASLPQGLDTESRRAAALLKAWLQSESRIVEDLLVRIGQVRVRALWRRADDVPAAAALDCAELAAARVLLRGRHVPRLKRAVPLVGGLLPARARFHVPRGPGRHLLYDLGLQVRRQPLPCCVAAERRADAEPCSVPLVYYVFYRDVEVRNFYLVVGTLLCASTLVSAALPSHILHRAKRLRVLGYVGAGAFAVLPLAHAAARWGLDSDEVRRYANGGGLVVVGALYLVGAVVYISRFPEVLFPGKFDLVGASHQVWHVLVFAAAVVHYFGVVELFHWRMEQEAAHGNFSANGTCGVLAGAA
jgi:hypothetical protein